MAADKVTRTMNVYDITAYGVDNNVGTPSLQPLCKARCQASSMNKSLARKALKEATGEKPRNGATIVWEVVERITYAMPLRDFLEQAIVIKHES